MTFKQAIRKLAAIESVLDGVVPSAKYTGKRRDRQFERLEDAFVLVDELREFLQINDPSLTEDEK